MCQRTCECGPKERMQTSETTRQCRHISLNTLKKKCIIFLFAIRTCGSSKRQFACKTASCVHWWVDWFSLFDAMSMARVTAEQKSSDHRCKSLSLFVGRNFDGGVGRGGWKKLKEVRITELLPVDEECEFIYWSAPGSKERTFESSWELCRKRN